MCCEFFRKVSWIDAVDEARFGFFVLFAQEYQSDVEVSLWGGSAVQLEGLEVCQSFFKQLCLDGDCKKKSHIVFCSLPFVSVFVSRLVWILSAWCQFFCFLAVCCLLLLSGMTLTILSDSSLLEKSVGLVAEEKRITLSLIDHLREIERRMLFAEMGYSSLFDFCVRHLGLSEGSTHRRISVMRLIRDVPSVRSSIVEGKLSLTSATTLHTFFQAEKRRGKRMTTAGKEDVIHQVAGLSKRECEAKLFEISPLALPREKERVISATETEIRFIADHELMAMLSELKGLLAHRLPSGANGDIIKCALGELVAGLRRQKMGDVIIVAENPAAGLAVAVPPVAAVSHGESPGLRTYLAAPLRREVWRRASGRCEFLTVDHKRCFSRHALEIDHIKPVAHGGTGELTNLRLVCRVHNQQQALSKVGPEIMSRYLPVGM